MMSSLIKRLHHDEKGMILPLVLAFMVLGLLIVTPTLGQGYVSARASGITEDRAEELYAADSGIEEAMYWLINGHGDNAHWTWDEDREPAGMRVPYDLNGATVTVEVRRHTEPDYYVIWAQAIGPRGSTTVLSRVWAAPGYADVAGEGGIGSYTGNVYVDGSTKLEAEATINGNLIVNGDEVRLENNSTVEGSVSVTGSYIQENDTTVIGNVCAGGSIVIENHGVLEGDIYLLLEDGADVIVKLEDYATAGDLYVATSSGTAHVNLKIEGVGATLGDVWLTSSVSYTLKLEGTGATCGTIHQDWDEEDPPPPECPAVSGSGSGIYSYEIL